MEKIYSILKINFYGSLNKTLVDNKEEALKILLQNNVISDYQKNKRNESISIQVSDVFANEINNILLVYGDFHSHIYFLMEEIELKLNAYIKLNDKIKYLENRYTEVYNSVNYQTLTLFNGSEFNGATWLDYVKLFLNDNLLFVIKYLQQNNTYSPPIELDDLANYNIKLLDNVIVSLFRDCDMGVLLKETLELINVSYELDYIKSIINHLMDGENSENNSTIDNKISALEVAYYAYYSKAVNTSFTKELFPSEKGYKELSLIYNANWKNIQQKYNLISTSKVERLKKKRYIKIEKIIPLLTSDEAKQLARLEANTSKINS